MKKIVKPVSLILSIAMLAVCFPALPITADDGCTPHPIICVNPRYADVITVDSLSFAQNMGDAVITTPYDPGVEYYTDTASAGAELREALKRRETEYSIFFACKKYSDDYIYDIVDIAMEHTGVPTEGDYIAWQYGGWGADMSYFSANGMMYLEVMFEFDYYADASEEAMVDSAVAELLDRLDLNGLDDYGKLCRIYEWICQNIEYDYENLDNEYYLTQYTAYGAIIDRICVCQGYAVLLYRLMLECGIDARVITSIDHAWNIIKMEDLYYNADSTWDAWEGFEMSNAEWFLKGSDNFPEHEREDEYLTPAFNAAYPMSRTDYVYVPRHEDILGDVDGNGAVDIIDISCLIDYVAGTSRNHYTNGDFNGDGWTNLLDVSLLMQYVSGT